MIGTWLLSAAVGLKAEAARPVNSLKEIASVDCRFNQKAFRSLGPSVGGSSLSTALTYAAGTTADSCSTTLDFVTPHRSSAIHPFPAQHPCQSMHLLAVGWLMCKCTESSQLWLRRHTVGSTVDRRHFRGAKEGYVQLLYNVTSWPGGPLRRRPEIVPAERQYLCSTLVPLFCLHTLHTCNPCLHCEHLSVASFGF